MFDVVYFEKEDGSCPISEFLHSLDLKMAVRVYGMISLLQENGNMLREPYSKYLKNGIFELRIQSGSDISRILYFFYVGRKIILTNGFIKKTQNTPKKEMELAQKYREQYIEEQLKMSEKDGEGSEK